ncbi:MAG: hypothetical protein V6Z82_02725 [Flavobacteriales bacterium]
MGEFSVGQQIFALVFLLLFLASLLWAYRRDLAAHRKYYRGVGMLSLSMLLIVFLLYVIKVVFYN